MCFTESGTRQLSQWGEALVKRDSCHSRLGLWLNETAVTVGRGFG